MKPSEILTPSQVEQLIDNDDDDEMDPFLSEFSNFTSVHDEDGDDDGNEEWIRACFGRGTTVRKNFKAHLSGHFLQNCVIRDGLHSFDRFKISSGTILSEIKERYICTNCCKSRRFFCYSCFSLSPLLVKHLPLIALPIRIDIVKHAKEVDGKSTAPHAAILAPSHVRIFIYPQLPDDWPDDPSKILLIFPRKNAPSVTEYLDQHYSSSVLSYLQSYSRETKPNGGLNINASTYDVDLKREKIDELSNTRLSATINQNSSLDLPFERVVFIDSTWRQTKPIVNDLRIKGLQAVVIDAEETRFWRCDQRRPITFLSTIEAIYYFCLQLHQFMSTLADRVEAIEAERDLMDKIGRKNDTDRTEKDKRFAVDIQQLRVRFSPYDGQYDNLLFFFKHTFHMIKNRYHL